MSTDGSYFSETLSQLQRFATEKGTFLAHSEKGGQVHLHCLNKTQRLIGKDRTSQTTLCKIRSFLDSYQFWFEPRDHHYEVLFQLQRKFPKALGSQVACILERIHSLPIEEPAPGMEQAQDVRLLIHQEGGSTERWIHSEVLEKLSLNPSYDLENYVRDGANSTTSIDLWLAPLNVVDAALEMLYHPTGMLPEDPETLVDLYFNAAHIKPLLHQSILGLRDEVLTKLSRSLNLKGYFHILEQIQDWDSCIGDLVVDFTAQHFDTLMQAEGIRDLPPSIMAKILDHPRLQLEEAFVVRGVVRWARHRQEEDLPSFMTQSSYDGKSLADRLRFEHLSVKQFVKLVANTHLLPDEQVQEWSSWLDKPSLYPEMPQRMARLPFFCKSSENGRVLSLWWHLPARALIEQHHSPKRRVLRLSKTPSFQFSGDNWEGEFCLMPFGSYVLSLRRLCEKNPKKAIGVHWKTEPGPRQSVVEQHHYFSEGFVVADLMGYPSDWLNCSSPETECIPVHMTLTRTR